MFDWFLVAWCLLLTANAVAKHLWNSQLRDEVDYLKKYVEPEPTFHPVKNRTMWSK